MSLPITDPTTSDARPYEAPTLVLLGSVEAITMSSNHGSFNDFKGRSSKKV